MYKQLNTYLRHLTAVSLLCCCGTALAVDGVIEINQARALAGGVTPGDTPGFPVTLDQPGSYRLTGNLDLSAEGGSVSGIVVSAPAVTVDLGGFQIAGPTSCVGIGSIISCTPASTGVGSYGVRFTFNAPAGVVQNGFVRNMTDSGILGEAIGLRVQSITVRHNGGDGINVSLDSQVMNSVALENGGNGIAFSAGTVVDGVTTYGNGDNGIRGRGFDGGLVTRTSARRNGLRGFNLDPRYKFGKNNTSNANEQTDSCGGGICTERRRVYMTKTGYSGATALTACARGFHMATRSELFNLSEYDYDTELGFTHADSGGGPPIAFGAWARGASRLNTGDNCSVWTSTGGKGSMLVWLLDGNFVRETPACISEIRVWCAESH